MTEIVYPEDGRLIRIESTPATESMGIAGWEVVPQGRIEEAGLYFFYRPQQLLGSAKLAIPVYVPWRYVEEAVA
jgi:hypothetical protein